MNKNEENWEENRLQGASDNEGRKIIESWIETVSKSDEKRKLFNNKGINKISFLHEEFLSCLCVQSSFYSIIIHYATNNEKERRKGEREMYDNDNNIKPIEVNFNNNEYIIFLSSARVSSWRRSWWRLSYIFLVIKKIFLSRRLHKSSSLAREM
jgi:hypothetical protein